MDQKWNASLGNWGKPCPTGDARYRMGTPQAPPENPEGSTAAVEGEADAQSLENRNLEDGELFIPLEARSAPEEGSPRE